MEHFFQIGVIGAGAAGLMAAAEAARRGVSVVLLEKNRKTGVKILMSGGTRCNITHNTDAKGIAKAFMNGGRFLQSSLGAFPPRDVVKMFEELGVPTKVEPTGKVFPVSDRALHVRDALLNQALSLGVQLHTDQAVLNVEQTDKGYWSVSTKNDSYVLERLIITTGGKSWPGCGTTGDAYSWLSGLGHQIVYPRPALVPLVGGSKWMHALSGVTLPDCQLTLRGKVKGRQKKICQTRNSLLLTHQGFSGPAAMDISGALTAAESFHDCQLLLDCLPDIDDSQLLGLFLDRQQEGGKQRITASLGRWLPKRLAQTLASEFDADCTVAELPKASRGRLIEALKRLPLMVKGTLGFEKAEVTAGGVRLDEVNPKTMESLLRPSLYIAGEVLDVDGPIGGYNFQAAFSTGRAAGIAAAESIHTATTNSD